MTMPRRKAFGTIPPPDHVVVLQALPPYSTKYKDTNDYYWPLISTKDDTAYVNAEKKALAVPDTRGPFGFGDAVQLKDDKCIVKSNFGKKGDRCILHPKDCHRGISFSIWEKVSYKEDVLNVDKDHDKRYVFSTGGDFDEEKGLLYPGMAIYHQGMDLIAVVATDNDVWQLNVRGQLVNETWSNIGIRWEPNPSNPNLPLSEQGGLELYVNAEKIGHAIKPLKKPSRPPPEVENKWIERPLLEPDWRKPSWNKIAEEAPIMMIGCHRNSDDENYRDFCREDTAFDELAIWTRKLNVNRTHNEVLYFTAGYDPQFEGLTLDKWAEMLDRVELHDPGQMEIAGIVSAQFSQQAKELANVISPLTSSIDESDNVQVVTDLESSSAGKSDKIYPRTDQEQEDFDRAQLSYESAKKLLNFDGLRTIERPRYLVKRWSVVPTASISLEDEHENIHGWESVVLDPDQEGASQLVKRIERYSMYYMNSADLREGENFDGFYDASKPMMMVHAHSSAITMTVAKLTMQGLKSFGGRIDVKKMASQNTVNNFTEWDNHNEYLEIPSTIMFKNESLCGNKSFTLLTAIYNGYGKMGPLRRNPQSLRAKEIKLDSKAISVQLMVSPNPDRLDEDLSSCQLDHEKMRYHPVTIRFYHYDKQTSLRKLLWHEDDLDTNIEVRKCAVYNDDIGRYGAWDADKCTTVLSEQHSTVCECYTTGTFILIAEMVEPPAYGPEYDWLWIVKYVGYGLSIVLLLVFITVIFINPFLWEMFHVLRGITGFCYCVALICMFVAENEGIRKDRHDNIAISVFQQYWFLATCVSLLAESFATFRAITGGIIGGKTLGYIPMIFGLPMIDIGVTMFLYGDDYGRDPRAFIGWANDTKLVFFYAIFAAAGLAVLLCFVIIFNISTPQTRKDSVVEQLSSQGTGLTVMVMIFAMTWGFAFPAYIRFPDRETPDFFPIFQVLNAWSGVFVMAFLGMSSSRFRAGLLGNGSLKGSPLFKYMVSSKRRKRHAMAFGAFFGGDGNLSGLSSRAMSSESLPSGPDSLDEDIEAGNNDEDYDSADSLDNDDVDSSNDEKKVKEESSSSDSEGDESDSGSGKDV